MTSIESNTLLKRSDSLMSARLGELEQGTVILNKDTNAYFGVDGVAAFIWEQLDSPLALAEVVNRVQEKYAVDGERARDDARDFVLRLIDKGLVDVVE